MPDWLDAIPNFGVPGVPGVEPQKPAGYSGTPAKYEGVPGVPAPKSENSRNPPRAGEEHRARREHIPDANEVRRRLRAWQAALSSLQPDKVPPRFDPPRWGVLVEDARWLYTAHGRQLAEQGWSDLDVFGVSLRRPRGEVLLDRLAGSRTLRLDGKGLAFWSWAYSSVIAQTCRGYAELQTAGAIVPLWELARRG